MVRTTALVAASVFLLGACSEQRYARFPSGTSALASETARRGWIPSWLPPTAGDVAVWYDLDTNYIWLSFRLPSSQAATFQRSLRVQSEEDIRARKLPQPRRRHDWLDGLIHQQPENDAAINARVFVGDGANVPVETCLAFERGTDRVYAWIPDTSR